MPVPALAMSQLRWKSVTIVGKLVLPPKLVTRLRFTSASAVNFALMIVDPSSLKLSRLLPPGH